MASPNDFFVQPGNDASQALSGLSGTLGAMRQEKARQAERQQMIDAENEKQKRIEDRFNAAKTAAQKVLKDGTPDEMAQVVLEYPEIGQGLTNALGLVDDDRKQKAASFARELISDPSRAEEIYQRRIDEVKSRGGDASDSERGLANFRRNPEAELRATMMTWAGTGDPSYAAFRDEQKAAAKARADELKIQREDERFAQTEAGKDRRAAQRAETGAGGSAATANRKDFDYYQELKRSDPVAATEFGRQAGFVSKEGKELSPQVQKRLSVATDEAIAAENNVAKFDNLANDIEKSDLQGGLLGTTTETLKELTGEQDAISNLRREYNAVKGSQVVNNLPPGAASDADIALAMAGFPSDRASKQQLVSFMRGLSKIQKMNADLNNFKAQYISDTGSERGMLGAWKEQRSTPGSAPARQSAPAAAAPAGPSVGAVVDGYRFKGGDPANPASWEAQ